MTEGTVKWFSNEKGYGFIEISEGKDVFVHHKNIAGSGFKSLNEGDRVEFTIASGPKGDHAEEVTKI